MRNVADIFEHCRNFKAILKSICLLLESIVPDRFVARLALENVKIAKFLKIRRCETLTIHFNLAYLVSKAVTFGYDRLSISRSSQN